MQRRMTKTERLAEERMARLLWQSQRAEDDSAAGLAVIQTPEAWATIEMDIDCQEPKEKVTLYLDRSVARVFKRMGSGYQARINRILATWLQFSVSRQRLAARTTERSIRTSLGKGQDLRPSAAASLRAAQYVRGWEDGQAAFRRRAVEQGWVRGADEGP